MIKLEDRPLATQIDVTVPLSFTALCTMNECLLQGVLAHRTKYSDRLYFYRSNRDIISGNVFHELLYRIDQFRALDDSQKSKAILEAIEQEIDKYRHQSSDKPFFKNSKSWPKLKHIYKTILQKSKEPLDENVLREVEITSSNGRIKGIVDYIERTPDGLVFLDYKSSVFSDESTLNEQYVDQIHFYAALSKSEYSEHPTRAYIEFFYGQKVEVAIQLERIQKIVMDANSVYERLEKLKAGMLSLEDLATKEAGRCSKCKYNFLCPSYLNNKLDNNSDYIACVLVEAIKADKEGSVFRAIGGGYNFGEDFVFEDAFDSDIKPSEKLVFVNVRRSSFGRLRASSDSRVYRM